LSQAAEPGALPPFTVTARSKDGQSVTSTVSYTVLLPDNRFTVPQVKTCRDGTVKLAVKVPGPGTIDVLETAWNDNLARVAVLLQPAKDRFVYAREHTNAPGAGTVRLRVIPTARGRRRPRSRLSCDAQAVCQLHAGGRRVPQCRLYGLHLPK
jgi:hypothetical protein